MDVERDLGYDPVQPSGRLPLSPSTQIDGPAPVEETQMDRAWTVSLRGLSQC